MNQAESQAPAEVSATIAKKKDSNITVLTPSRFISCLRSLLEKVGLKAELYAGHNFRIGAATTAASAGLPDWLIQAMGRWNSVCYKRYIRITNHSLQGTRKEMALASSIW